MNKLHMGYVQGTHGLKGDLKIKNLFKDPTLVYKVNQEIYLNLSDV